MGTCTLEITAGAKQLDGTFKGTAAIGPSGCSGITYTSAGCKATFPSQSNIPGVTLQNVGSGSTRGVEIDLHLTKLKNTVTAVGLTCSTNGTFTDGVYEGSFQINGFNELEESVGIQVS